MSDYQIIMLLYVAILEVQQKILSFIIPSVKKQRDIIIIHSGSNDDSSYNAVTINNLQSKKQSSHTKFAISSILT